MVCLGAPVIENLILGLAMRSFLSIIYENMFDLAWMENTPNRADCDGKPHVCNSFPYFDYATQNIVDFQLVFCPGLSKLGCLEII